MIGALEPVRWSDPPGAIDVLDQTRLPGSEARLRLESVEQVVEAIRSLRVRGAPAIGIAAAMGLALEAAKRTSLEPPAFERALADAYAALVVARPTAVNLRWALDRLMRVARAQSSRPPGVIACKLWGEATGILEEDRAMSRRIGEHGLELVPDGARVLTHCNAGALATGGLGTALAPIYVAAGSGRRVEVYATETRPLLQGSRLTTWELARAGVPVTLLVDSAAAWLLRSGGVDLVLVGADRIAANGDVANKVGTYGLALLARAHGIPFYVAAPTSTVDLATLDGAGIEIEERDADEVRRGFGRATAPPDVPVYAPAFDVTPAHLVSALITDVGVLRAPYAEAIGAALERKGERESERIVGGTRLRADGTGTSEDGMMR